MKVLRAFGQRLPRQILSRHFYTGLLVIAIFTAGFAMGSQSLNTFAQNEADVLPPADADQTFAAFWETYNLIEKNYLNRGEIDEAALVDGATRGLVEALEDQYSAYIEPEFFEFVDDGLSGEIEGIGATVSEDLETGEVLIENVLPNTPAEAAGLLEGDVFVEVDGEDISELTYLEVVSRVRGPAGTVVTLLMRRNEDMIEFNVERAPIQIPNTEVETLEGGIGYFQLYQYTPDARQQFNEALEELDYENLNGLIIDLRGNPGGFLTSAIEFTSALIPEGVIVSEDFGEGATQAFEATGDAVDLGGIPVVLLIDERSASASEITAGAWQERDVATLIGVTTVGKGTVQTQSELVNGGGLRLTVARWLTPEGNSIQDQGIEPDIFVTWDAEARAENPDDDPQLEAALQFLSEGEVDEALISSPAEATQTAVPAVTETPED